MVFSHWALPPDLLVREGLYLIWGLFTVLGRMPLSSDLRKQISQRLTRLRNSRRHTPSLPQRHNNPQTERFRPPSAVRFPINRACADKVRQTSVRSEPSRNRRQGTNRGVNWRASGEHQRNDQHDKTAGDLRFRRSPNECHVGMGRFELPTPCSQSRCATWLRHIPDRRPVYESSVVGGPPAFRPGRSAVRRPRVTARRRCAILSGRTSGYRPGARNP